MREREKQRNYRKKHKEPYSPEMDIEWEKLSTRELQCVYWAIRGYENSEIGEKLFIEGHTVERHMGVAYQKTNISLVEGSAVRKLLWFANRDNMIEHLGEDGQLSQEYLATRHMDRYVAQEYRTEIEELRAENKKLRELAETPPEIIGVFSPLNLSPKELEIAKMIKDGKSNVNIAICLKVATPYVSHVCKSLKDKLGIREGNTTGRTRLAIELQLYDLNVYDDDDLGPRLTNELIEVAERMGKQ